MCSKWTLHNQCPSVSDHGKYHELVQIESCKQSTQSRWHVSSSPGHSFRPEYEPVCRLVR